MQPPGRHKLIFKVGNKCTENECGLISAGLWYGTMENSYYHNSDALGSHIRQIL